MELSFSEFCETGSVPEIIKAKLLYYSLSLLLSID
jgi:hypothetical protein